MTLIGQSNTRAKAALVLAQHKARKLGGDIREHIARYIGHTGGDHIFRDKQERIWSVDLVTGSCMLNVGTPPAQWKHPPRFTA